MHVSPLSHSLDLSPDIVRPQRVSPQSTKTPPPSVNDGKYFEDMVFNSHGPTTHHQPPQKDSNDDSSYFTTGLKILGGLSYAGALIFAPLPTLALTGIALLSGCALPTLPDSGNQDKPYLELEYDGCALKNTSDHQDCHTAIDFDLPGGNAYHGLYISKHPLRVTVEGGLLDSETEGIILAVYTKNSELDPSNPDLVGKVGMVNLEHPEFIMPLRVWVDEYGVPSGSDPKTPPPYLQPLPEDYNFYDYWAMVQDQEDPYGFGYTPLIIWRDTVVQLWDLSRICDGSRRECLEPEIIFNDLVSQGYINNEGGLLQRYYDLDGKVEDFTLGIPSTDNQREMIVRVLYQTENGFAAGYQKDISVFQKSIYFLLDTRRSAEGFDFYTNLIFDVYKIPYNEPVSSPELPPLPESIARLKIDSFAGD